MNICDKCYANINDDSYYKNLCNECTNELRKDWFIKQYEICDECDNIIYDVMTDMCVKDIGDNIKRKRHQFCQQYIDKQEERVKILIKKWNITQKSIDESNKKQEKEEKEAKVCQDARDKEENEAIKAGDKKFKELKLQADKKTEKEQEKHRKNKEEMEKYIAQVDSKALKEAKQKAKLAKAKQEV